jgi:hypothetical protein
MMHLAPWLKSRPAIFLTAVTILSFGILTIFLAVQRFHKFGKWDGGMVLGVVFVLLGGWAFLYGDQESD